MLNFAYTVVGVCATVLTGMAAAACGSGNTSLAPSQPTDTTSAAVPQIVVLGDSLAVSPSRSQSFPTRLQARLNANGQRWTIVNAGVAGDVTAGGLRRLGSALTSDTRILVLELGANDGLRGLPVNAIEKNLASIIEQAQERNIRVLLCGMETPPTNGWDYTVAFHKVYPALAARYSVPLVPFLLAGVVLNPDLNGPDGVHPNAAGAQRIADMVWPYLESLVQQDRTVVNGR